MLQLRDYQLECINLVLAAFKSDPHGSEFLVLPCGAGKTIIFSAIIQALAREYVLAALILAHRDELLDQATDKYHFIDPGAIIGKIAGPCKEYGAPITVASIATVSRQRHLKQLETLYGNGKGLIIVVDEAHHVMAEGYQRLLKSFPEAFVLGVTATPDRLDKKQIFGGKKPLFSMSIIDGIKRKFLCSMRTIAISTETVMDIQSSARSDYNEHELDLAINTPYRNKHIVEKYKEYANGKRTICFCVTVAHAEALAYTFNDQGIPAAVVVGDTGTDERKRLYAALRAGELLVLVSVLVLAEGFDEPSVECAIMARPTQSRSLFVQAIGRAVRPFPGKREAIILDITDNWSKHKLAPINLRSALNLNIKDGESVDEALAREEVEKAEKEALVRKLAMKRVKDIHINLLEVLEWKELENGTYVMEVGRAKHRIALVPSKNNPTLFEVWARLSPLSLHPPKAQKWNGAQPIEDAQMWAEKRIRMLHDDPDSKKLLDKSAAWRSQPIDPASDQVRMLTWCKIAWTSEMTRGQASDLIDAHKDELEKKKAAKAARKKELEMAQ
ncbi:DEAD/DEAH box helicase [Ktedonobacteria bacterium brp13]|nr:DEAD/DEAH box helicase [Ktedonobacteria bacterium brp13]